MVSAIYAENQWLRLADQADYQIKQASKWLREGAMVDGRVFTQIQTYLASLREAADALKAVRHRDATAAASKLRSLEGRLGKLGVKANPGRPEKSVRWEVEAADDAIRKALRRQQRAVAAAGAKAAAGKLAWSRVDEIRDHTWHEYLAERAAIIGRLSPEARQYIENLPGA
jgi:hypothetical protein